MGVGGIRCLRASPCNEYAVSPEVTSRSVENYILNLEAPRPMHTVRISTKLSKPCQGLAAPRTCVFVKLCSVVTDSDAGDSIFLVKIYINDYRVAQGLCVFVIHKEKIVLIMSSHYGHNLDTLQYTSMTYLLAKLMTAQPNQLVVVEAKQQLEVWCVQLCEWVLAFFPLQQLDLKLKMELEVQKSQVKQVFPAWVGEEVSLVWLCGLRWYCCPNHKRMVWSWQIFPKWKRNWFKQFKSSLVSVTVV